ncbi:hypothetical protein JHK85_049989 [Glycine max]|nr:hypothetical protein JHK85_049989 [Glycine max]
MELEPKKGPVHDQYDDLVGSFSSSSSSTSSSVSGISSGSSLESDSFEEGKSQSFTSLTNVRSLEDLAKPENPYNKRLKSCKSYAGGLAESHSTRAVSKRGMVHSTSSRGSCSSFRRGSATTNFMGSRPPIPPHRSTSTNTIPNQTVLFA